LPAFRFQMATGTTNSGASQFTTVTSAFSTAENDSGIGQTTDSAALVRELPSQTFHFTETQAAKKDFSLGTFTRL